MLRRIRDKPPREIAAQVVRRLATWTDLPALEFPLLPGDIADSGAVEHRPVRVSAAPRVGWVIVPPGPGSGGHTTLFRMVRAAVKAGLPSTLLFYDRYRGDFERNARLVREWWPWLDVEIRPVEGAIQGYDAVVASSWPTAHVLATRGRSIPARLYFVQDYEPYFYPRGGTYALAEDSYRLGLRIIALGSMVHQALGRELGVTSDLVPFGLDTDVYRLLGNYQRRGVVHYARMRNDRRGGPLAVRALERFHRAHPEQPVHVYGDRLPGLGFPAVQHGTLSPDELNGLYNQVIGGIALSFTNISLVPEEMLAAGAIPVVNDGWMPRAGLDNRYVAWAEPTPVALADALGRVVTDHDPATAASAADSVQPRTWAESGAQVARIIRAELAR